jgi:hypothetical protein
MHTRRIFGLLISAISFLTVGCATRHAVSSTDGFEDIFDGKSLSLWEGDSTYWKVEDGLLVGEVTPATLLKQNSFIIWRGGSVRDFEVKVEYRISDKGNSGINYRSEETGRHVLRGYQADMDGALDYIGSNYEERGRTTLASLGERVELPELTDSSLNADALAKNIHNNRWKHIRVIASLGDPDSLRRFIRKLDWNEYHLIVKGNRLQHFVNGVLMSDVTDNDTRNARREGLFGVQVHVGPPMKVEYRKIRLKRL